MRALKDRVAGRVRGEIMRQQGAMRVISVNTGLPRRVDWQGKAVLTGIFKEPVAGRIPVRRHNLDGDRQADLTVHGGRDKAVYAYPSEHYPYWRAELPEVALPWAQFGENLTTEGLLEDAAGIGDRYRVGTAELVVTQPRFPCYKLGIRFGRPDILRRFLRSGRPGIYFSVAQEGEIEAGDPIVLIERAGHSLSVAEIALLYARGGDDRDLLERAAALESLPETLRDHFGELLAHQP